MKLVLVGLSLLSALSSHEYATLDNARQPGNYQVEESAASASPPAKRRRRSHRQHAAAAVAAATAAAAEEENNVSYTVSCILKGPFTQSHCENEREIFL